jgi:hypothetical protein
MVGTLQNVGSHMQIPTFCHGYTRSSRSERELPQL